MQYFYNRRKNLHIKDLFATTFTEHSKCRKIDYQSAGKLMKSCKQLILGLKSQGYKSEYNVITKQ